MRALGVVDAPLSGYCAVAPVGLDADQMVAPAIAKLVRSTTEARSQRNRLIEPPAAVGTNAEVQFDRYSGSCVRSIVTL